MPEGFFGRDWAEQAKDLGTLDKDEVVTFYRGLGFGDMPYDELKKLGGADRVDELHNKIKQRQIEAAKAPGGYTGGFNVSDYYFERVTEAECLNLGADAAEKACADRILVKSTRLAGGKNISGYVEAPIGTLLIVAGGALTYCGHPYIGVPMMLVGGLIGLKGVKDLYDAQKIGEAGRNAAKKYCCCPCGAKRGYK